MQVFYMKFKVVAPRDVAILQFAFPKHGWVKVLVILGMRVLANKSTNIDVLACPVIEHHINGNVIVANKAHNRKDVLAHIFRVILMFVLFFGRKNTKIPNASQEHRGLIYYFFQLGLVFEEFEDFRIAFGFWLLAFGSFMASVGFIAARG